LVPIRSAVGRKPLWRSRAVEYDLGGRFWHRLLRSPQDPGEEQRSHRE